MKYTFLDGPAKDITSFIKDIARRKVKDRREMTYLVFDRNAQIQFL